MEFVIFGAQSINYHRILVNNIMKYKLRSIIEWNNKYRISNRNSNLWV